MENHTENAFWLCCIHDLCCSLLVEPHKSDRLSALLVCQVSMDSKSLIHCKSFVTFDFSEVFSTCNVENVDGNKSVIGLKEVSFVSTFFVLVRTWCLQFDCQSLNQRSGCVNVSS